MKKLKLLVIFSILSNNLLGNLPNAIDLALEDGQKKVVTLLSSSTGNNTYLLSYFSYLIKEKNEKEVLNFFDKNKKYFLESKNTQKLFALCEEFNFFSPRLFDVFDAFFIENEGVLDKSSISNLVNFYRQAKQNERSIKILEKLSSKEYKRELVELYMIHGDYRKLVNLINGDENYFLEEVFALGQSKDFTALKNILEPIVLASSKLRNVLFELYISFIWRDVRSAEEIKKIILEKETKSASIVKSFNLLSLFKNNQLDVLEDRLNELIIDVPYLDYIYFLLSEYYLLKNDHKKARKFFSFIKKSIWKSNYFYLALKQTLFPEEIEQDLPLIEKLFVEHDFDQDKLVLAMLLLKKSYRSPKSLIPILKTVNDKFLKSQLALLLLSHSNENINFLVNTNLLGIELILNFDWSKDSYKKNIFVENIFDKSNEKIINFDFIYNKNVFKYNFLLYLEKKGNLLFENKLRSSSSLLIRNKKSFLYTWYNKIITWQNLFLEREYELLDEQLKKFFILEKNKIEQVNKFVQSSYFFAHYYLLLESAIAQRKFGLAKKYTVKLREYKQFPEQEMLLLAREIMIDYLYSFRSNKPIVYLKRAKEGLKKLVEDDFVPKLKYSHLYRLAKVYHRLSIVDKKNQDEYYFKYVNLLQKSFNEISVSEQKLFLRIGFELRDIYKNKESKYSIENILNSLREKGFLKK